MKKEENNNKININLNIDKTKLLKGVGLVAVVLAIIGLSFFVSKSYGATGAYEFTDITIDEYLELMKSETKKIVYVARPNCSFCVRETPILKKIANENGLEVYYLDTTNFYDSNIQDYTEDGYKFLNSAEIYKEGFGTPNTIVVQNGEVVDGVYQYVEASELEDLFERNGFINE